MFQVVWAMDWRHSLSHWIPMLQLFSWLGVLKSLVLRIYWPSNERIASVTAPVLFICGTHDEIVPHEHSKLLYDLATAAKCQDMCCYLTALLPASFLNVVVVCVRTFHVPFAARELYMIPGGKHNDCWQVGGQSYLDKFREFITDVASDGADTSRRSRSKFRL
jgi:pimeloyl-ACP methyl ester carboxylesterase